MNTVPAWMAAAAVGGFASLLAALIWLPGASLAEDTTMDDPALIEAGKSIFSQHHCDNEFCHGPKGSGNMMGVPPGTKLADSKWFHADGSFDGVVKIITDGILSSPMEPWGTRLGPEKIRQVAAYVLSLSKGK